MMSFDVNNIRILLALLMLGIASYTDIRKREVNDMLWIIFGGLSIVTLFFTPDILHSLISVGISLIVAPIVLLVWRMGFFGGADAFALIVLASLAPGSTFSNAQITPLTTLTNAALLSIIPIIINMTRNIISILQHKDIFEGFENETQKSKIIALFMGYRAKNPRFGFSIEKKDGNSRKFDFALKNADSAEFCSSHDTWITPGMPYLIYIFGGFVVQLVFGDMIFSLIKTL
jgi:preflagellin peptidase FlaK